MVNTIRNRMISGRQSDPGHYIFIGNPGTGKTTVARYFGQIMRNLGMLKRGHVVEYTATDLMNEVFNRENNGNFVEVAKKALDGILFIDEAYLLEQTKNRAWRKYFRRFAFLYGKQSRQTLCYCCWL